MTIALCSMDGVLVSFMSVHQRKMFVSFIWFFIVACCVLRGNEKSLRGAEEKELRE